MMALGSAVQTNGLGLALVSCRKWLMAAWRSGDVCEDAAYEPPPCQLGEEALNRVEPGGRGRGEVELKALVPPEPGTDLGMLVRGVIVDNQMHCPLGWGLAVDLVEEADELLMPVAAHALTDDLAVEHVERGEQGGCPVPLIVVGHRAATAALHWQPRLGAVERLNLALLIDRQHRRVSRRIEI